MRRQELKRPPRVMTITPSKETLREHSLVVILKNQILAELFSSEN